MAAEEICGCSPSSPCFFKLILEPRLDLHRLEIPTKFIRIHGKDLSNVIYLHTQTGKVWKFKLTRENGKVLIQNGWPNFVKFHSLSHGHSMMFQYVRKSHFDVVIFDVSTLETEYPHDPEPCTLIRPPPSKAVAPPNATIDDDERPMVVYRTSRTCFSKEEKERITDYTDRECKHASFAMKIQPSFFNRKCTVTIPTEFGKASYLDKKPCTLKLSVDGIDKRWQVNIIGGDRYGKFSAGWKKFLSDNNLKPNDICVFEKINNRGFKVAIIRAAANY